MLLLIINSEKFNCEKISFIIAHYLIKMCTKMQIIVVIYFILGVLCPSIWLKDKVLAAKSCQSKQQKSLYSKWRQMNWPFWVLCRQIRHYYYFCNYKFRFIFHNYSLSMWIIMAAAYSVQVGWLNHISWP